MLRSIIILSILIFVGCQTYNPVVDPGSVSPQKSDRYYRDKAECQALAKQNVSTTKETVKKGVIGGAVGGGTGTLIGAIAGNAAKGLALGAVIGGVAGGAKGYYDSEQEYESIYRNCMRGRGYNVLN